jgi:hypothetical protein
MGWHERLTVLTQHRDEMDFSALCLLFSAATEKEQRELDGCLSLFEDEYNIPKGLLRPEDPLNMFLEPPVSKGFFSWLFGRAAIEDKSSELNYRLKRQRKRIGRTPIPERPPTTVGEYVGAWLGRC